MGILPRVMAPFMVLIFLACTTLGSILPEFGNIVATRLGVRAHSFNVLFLVLGVAGVGVALYLGYNAGG